MHLIFKEKILFIDIETVPAFPDYQSMPEPWKQLWDKKSSFIDVTQPPDNLYARAGIYAEFGKIVCISCGFFALKNEGFEFRIKSFAGEEEKNVISSFFDLINNYYPSGKLCAHNGKEFDFPYLTRRALVNKIPLPELLNNHGKKPWEIKDLFYDTMEMWRFGDYKNYTSLELLCYLFGIPTPKSNLDGSKVGYTYWVEKDLAKIVHYCEQDIVALARVFLALTQGPSLPDSYIIYSKNHILS